MSARSSCTHLAAAALYRALVLSTPFRLKLAPFPEMAEAEAASRRADASALQDNWQSSLRRRRRPSTRFPPVAARRRGLPRRLSRRGRAQEREALERAHSPASAAAPAL